MRTAAPALLPIFRSQGQAEILSWLYLHPGKEFTLTDLANHAKVSVPTVHREAERLVQAQLVTEHIQGRNRLLAANPDHPAAESLGRLLEVTFGPRQVIGEEFTQVPGADMVIIFGSWAARYSGETGHTPNDVDVLVVGDRVERSDIYAAADRAQTRLGLAVNPTMRSHEQWTDPTDRLTSDINGRPKLVVSLVV